MSRVMFAIAFAGLIFAAASGTAHAAPILPLPAAATDRSDNMTDVQWGRRCWYDHWGRLRCRGRSYPVSSDGSIHRRDSAGVPSGHTNNVAPIARLSYYRCGP